MQGTIFSGLYHSIILCKSEQIHVTAITKYKNWDQVDFEEKSKEAIFVSLLIRCDVRY